MTDAHKEQITNWLQTTPTIRGVLLRSVRFPDQTCISDGAGKDLVGLEHAWRVMTDTFHVLSAQHFPPNRLSWVYDRATLHCVQRADGAMLGIFANRKAADVDTDGLNRLLIQFQSLALANPSAPIELQ